MNETEGEETVTLSLVDGITCGLAAALLLLIVFGVNMAASSARLGGTSGFGTTSAKEGDMPTEPVDIVVEIEGPVKASESGTDWEDPRNDDVRDGKAVDPSGGGRRVFIREIRDPTALKKWKQDPGRYVSFVLKWKDPGTQPRGTVRIFRSGEDVAFRFKCRSGQESHIMRNFDFVHTSLKGSDCSMKKVT